MKVMCINEGSKWMGESKDYIPPKDIQVGGIYTVIDFDYYEGREYYMLEEVPPTMDCIFTFLSELFSPLSDIDETELVNEYDPHMA